jgi:cellulose synthase/poly-beta-1,6-N-acetylglucosamine synthase-like glycosyltransferase
MSGDFPPRVSVIMASWNRPQFLASAIDSVLAQTYQDFELIVADDGSAGPTHELLEVYARSPRVRVLWLTHCGVPAMVRNAALRAARGEYLAFVDFRRRLDAYQARAPARRASWRRRRALELHRLHAYRCAR